MLLRGRRRRSNDGCASAGEARLAVEGRGDEAADGGTSHGPKLPAATAPGPCFLDDAEASAALAPSRAELAPTACGDAPAPSSLPQLPSLLRPAEPRLAEPAPSPPAAASRAAFPSRASRPHQARSVPWTGTPPPTPVKAGEHHLRPLLLKRTELVLLTAGAPLRRPCSPERRRSGEEAEHDRGGGSS